MFYCVDEAQTEDTEKEVRKVLVENLTKMPKPKPGLGNRTHL